MTLFRSWTGVKGLSDFLIPKRQAVLGDEVSTDPKKELSEVIHHYAFTLPGLVFFFWYCSMCHFPSENITCYIKLRKIKIDDEDVGGGVGTKGVKNTTHYSSNRQLVHADYCVRTQTGWPFDSFNGSHHQRKVKSLVLLLFQGNALSLRDELIARHLIGCNT